MPRQVFALLLLSLLGPQSISAQDAGERWYRVELLVFEQPGGMNAEQWEPLPELRYPEPLRFLVNPQQLEATRNQYGVASFVDSRGRIVAAPTTVSSATPDDSSTLPENPALPAAFVELPNAQLELRDTAAYMQRAGGYRTLFHEAWLQPITDAARAIPMALDQSGDAQSWPELQGTITLSLARFLSIETNLWLNTQGSYLPQGWQMPPPPKAPSALLLSDALLPNQETPPGIDTAVSTQDDLPDTAKAELPLQADDHALAAAYPYRHAVLHQQTRRMRSNQMHYLDHPLLGVIIKLTPMATEESTEPGQDG